MYRDTRAPALLATALATAARAGHAQPVAAPPPAAPAIVATPPTPAPRVATLAERYVAASLSLSCTAELGWQVTIPSSGSAMFLGRGVYRHFTAEVRAGVSVGGAVIPFGLVMGLRGGASVGWSGAVHGNVVLGFAGGYDAVAQVGGGGAARGAHRLAGELRVVVLPWEHVQLELFAQLAGYYTEDTWQPAVAGGPRLGFWW